MGFGDFFKSLGNYAMEKYNDKVEEVDKLTYKMQYTNERHLFEIVYKHTKPGSMHPLNSEAMAARKILHDNWGYEYDEISERVREMYRERGR